MSLADMVLLAIGSLAMLAAPAYCVLQVWAPMKLSLAWRKASLASLLLAIPLLLWCAYAFADQSNLWPVPFILFAPFGTLYLALILAIGRKRTVA